MENKIHLQYKSSLWPGTVAHACNPSTLGVQDGQITSNVRKMMLLREIQDGRLATAQECSSQGKCRERVDAALSDEFLLPTDRESPGREATRVASATLLAGAALPGVEYTGRTGSAGPIPTRKTAIGSAED
ncbi:hypothetical protein AAY473_012357 [Plecturocebus cupreus]